MAAGFAVLAAGHQISPSAVAAAKTVLRTLADPIAASLARRAKMPARPAIAIADQQVGPCPRATTESRRHGSAGAVAAYLTRSAGDSAGSAVVSINKKVGAPCGASCEILGALAHAVHADFIGAALMATCPTIVSMRHRIRALAATTGIVKARNTLRPAVPAVLKRLRRDTDSLLTALAGRTGNAARSAIVKVGLQVDAGTHPGILVGITTRQAASTNLVAGPAIRILIEPSADAVAAVFVR